MKKLFAILAATLITCGLSVAPAFAAEERTVLGQDPSVIETYQTWEIIPTIQSTPVPLPIGTTNGSIDWDMPEPTDPGCYEIHIYTQLGEGWLDQGDLEPYGSNPYLGEMPKPNSDEKYVMTVQAPELPTDVELVWDDGGAYFAWAQTEDNAVSMCEQYVNENQSDDKEFSEIESGTYEAVTETEWVVDQEYKPAWTETIQHEAVTHEEDNWVEVSEGWAKCDKDGQSSYAFTGDKLIIHDGQTGYWFWSEKPMDNWREFAASTGINKADEVIFARSGYGTFNSKASDPSKHIIGNKTFTIQPGVISADGGISWVAWEHFVKELQGTITVVDKEAWTETIEHEAVLECGHYETKVIEPAVGWANVAWTVIDKPAPVPPHPVPPAPVDPVIPEDDPIDPVVPSDPVDDPILDPVVEPVVPASDIDVPTKDEPQVINDEPSPVGQVVASFAPTQYLPQTGDHFGDLDSLFAIIITVCLGIIFTAATRKLEA